MGDLQVDLVIKSETERLEDTVVQQIIEAEVEVEGPGKQMLARQELSTFKLQKKQAELEDSLKIMLNDGVITKVEYQNKLKQLKHNA